MRYFQNSLKNAVSVSFYFQDESFSVTIKPTERIEFPPAFNGPYSVGVSDLEEAVDMSTGESDGSSVDVPK